MSLGTMLFEDNDEIDDTLYQTYKIKLGKYNIEIPAGFKTDYASIPRFLLPFFVKYQKAYKKASVIHDWLYWLQKPHTRAVADKIFYDAMYLGEIPSFKRNFIYWGVRCFGAKAWNRNKKLRELRGLEYRITKVNKDLGVCSV